MKMAFTVPVEIQLMRNWEPRSRPSIGDLNVDTPIPSMTKLFPGAAAIGTENMIVTIEGATRVQPSWAALRVGLTIEGQPFSDPRPGLIFLGKAGIPTCIIHLPVMAGEKSLMFRGWHTLLLRTVL